MPIARASFPRPPTPSGWRTEIEQNTHAHYFLLESRRLHLSAKIGYVGYWLMANECHINTIAIHPRHRGNGYSKRLLRYAMRDARKQGAAVATLEVRESNKIAQHLYQQLGFVQVGTRPKFYKDNRENGLIMTVKLADPTENAKLIY